MSAEILALLAMFAVGAFVGVGFEKAMAQQRRSEWRRRQGWGSKGRGEKTLPFKPKPDALPDKVPDAAD